MDISRIKALAEQQGKKLSHLCDIVGRKPYYLTDIAKSPKRMIPDEYLKKIAIDLNTSVEYLKGETDDPSFDLSSVGLDVLPTSPQPLRPIFGQASAGTGTLAQQTVLGYEPVNVAYNTDDYFWLLVKGDSMSPVFTDRDLVLVQKDAPVESGTIMVVVIDDDEGFIKQVSVLEDTVTLHSFNPAYPPMVFGGNELGRLRFIGRVIEQKRKFLGMI